MPTKTSFIKDELDRRKSLHQLRKLNTISYIDGIEILCNNRRLVNLCSNDYLGLASHPSVKQGAIDFIQKYGTGSSSSRLICGNLNIHESIETKIARLCESEAALLFNSGFQANATLLSCLCNRHSLVIADKAVHQSLLHGVLASKAKLLRYAHQDMDHLQEILETCTKRFSRIVIVSESIFSIDGDQVDLAKLISLAECFDALLYIDDAHAIGVLGKNGMGLTAAEKGVDIAMGTFGKGGGSFGSFVACSSEMKDYLLNTCTGFIYSTALPPPVLGAIDTALMLIPEMELQRQTLRQNANRLREEIKGLGFNSGSSSSHIIPIYLKKEQTAISLSHWLEKQGFYAPSIRPPTVPKGNSVLRISLSAMHTLEHIEGLLDALRKWPKDDE